MWFRKKNLGALYRHGIKRSIFFKTERRCSAKASYTSSIDLRICSTFISIPITEEYNSSTNDQSWEDQANADINLLHKKPGIQQILRRARRRSGGRGRRWGPELRAPQQRREDAEQWREDLEAAGAAGRPGCAERATRRGRSFGRRQQWREDDEVRGGRSFGRRQQWREDDEVSGGRSFGRRQQWRRVGAAGKLGATSIWVGEGANLLGGWRG
jgi:hypothetical protein